MNTAAENSPLPAIAMRGVTVGALRDPESTVATDVNWTVAPGEFWVIGGLQGSGKSDFLMTTAGLMPPRTGDYRLFGEPMPIFEDARLAQRLRLGLVFDGGQLLNNLTVFDNVALPLRYHRSPPCAEVEETVRATLTALALLPWAASTPGALPRAWRKRAGLARALMLQPAVLLLDCPLSGLDLRHAFWWLQFLRALSRGHALFGGRPMTLAVTADDLRLWRDPTKQFALLDQRRFVPLGDWAQVERHPDPAVRLLLEGHRPTEEEPSA